MNREEKGAFPHETKRVEGLWALMNDILFPIIPWVSLWSLRVAPLSGLLAWHLL